MTDNNKTEAASSDGHVGALPFWLALGFLTFSALCWAGSSVAGRAASSNIAPFSLSFIRWGLVACCFAVLGGRETWQQRKLIYRYWRILSVFGFFGIVGFTVPYYVGLQFTIAVNATLMNASGTIWIVLLAFLMTGETITVRQALGVLLGLLGTITIVLRADFSMLRHLSVNIGDVLVLVSYFSWAVYTAMLRWKPRELGEIPFLVAIAIAASVMMLPLFLVDLWRGATFHASPETLAIIGYSVIFPSFLAYLCWNKAVVIVGAGVAGMAQYIIPVFGVILSVLILGEVVEDFHLAGIAIIFTGVWLVTDRRRRAR